MSELPPAPQAPPKPFPIGRLLVGVLIVGLGVVWLLDAVGAVDVDWDVLLPVALIVVGVALVVAAWQGRGRGGLIALGIVLTVILTIATVVRVPLSGGIGDRIEQPTSLAAVAEPFELAIGELTVDLSHVTWSGADVPGEVRVEAAVGMGHLVVLVGPDFPCVSTHAEAGVGEVVVFGERRSGVSPEYRTEAVCMAAPLLTLELSVGIGQVEVRRGT
ncbi:MAG TPA: hypothetical protein VFT27_05045 [Actinomycetota bacterium]|nr:hypothetical protein [Actinomycetota bacterium]